MTQKQRKISAKIIAFGKNIQNTICLIKRLIVMFIGIDVVI